MPARKYTTLCETPRYIPRYGGAITSYPPGTHPPNCPIKTGLTAVAVIRLGMVRW